MGEALLDDPRWHIFVGYAEGEAVATAASYVSDHAVDVTLVTCRKEARGRGFGRAVTRRPSRSTRRKPAMLLASDDGQPVYRVDGVPRDDAASASGSVRAPATSRSTHRRSTAARRRAGA